MLDNTAKPCIWLAESDLPGYQRYYVWASARSHNANWWCPLWMLLPQISPAAHEIRALGSLEHPRPSMRRAFAVTDDEYRAIRASTLAAWHLEHGGQG